MLGKRSGWGVGLVGWKEVFEIEGEAGGSSDWEAVRLGGREYGGSNFADTREVVYAKSHVVKYVLRGQSS